MKLFFENLKDSPLNLLRRAGYAFLRKDKKTGELSLVKRVGEADFPRFHIYIKKQDAANAELNLHLDQKSASYKGSVAHGGEYNLDKNKWLGQEAEIIKKEFEK